MVCKELKTLDLEVIYYAYCRWGIADDGWEQDAKQTVNLLKDQKNPWFICLDRSALAVGERAFRDGAIHQSSKQHSDHSLIG